MKHKDKITLLLSSSILFFTGLLHGQEDHSEDPHYVWFEGNGLAVTENGIFADSNKGMLQLNVVEYDRVNDRYKVLCSCLRRRGLDPGEALSILPEDRIE